MAVIDELINLNIEALTHDVTGHYGDIRAILQKSGQMIGNNDLWLAGHARSQDWVLVTIMKRNFCLWMD